MTADLLIKNEYESMISRAVGWERLQVVDNGVSSRKVISRNVSNHPVKVFAVFVRKMSVKVGHHQGPQRVLRVRLRQLKTDRRTGLSFFGFDDVP